MESMEFLVKGTDFLPLTMVDVYTSAIWTERLWEAGDFQIVLPLGTPAVEALQPGNYLELEGSDRTMIVEGLVPETDNSEGTRVITVTGRSLESILERRIVWTRTYLSGNLVTEVTKLLNNNIGANAGVNRRVTNFRVVAPGTATPEGQALLSLEIDAEFFGETLYEVMTSIGESYNIGWKITRSDDNWFEFRFIYGTDRTAEQADRDPVIFSPEYDTLINSKYLYDTSPYRNVALVLGEEKEDVPPVRQVVFAGSTEPTGLDRRELYENASDIKSEDENGNAISAADYNKALQYRGYEKLSENQISAVFDGEIETGLGAQYGVAYFMGDYVLALNEFGMGSVAQIREYIRSQDEDGYSAYPSFVMIN